MPESLPEISFTDYSRKSDWRFTFNTTLETQAQEAKGDNFKLIYFTRIEEYLLYTVGQQAECVDQEEDENSQDLIWGTNPDKYYYKCPMSNVHLPFPKLVKIATSSILLYKRDIKKESMSI